MIRADKFKHSIPYRPFVGYISQIRSYDGQVSQIDNRQVEKAVEFETFEIPRVVLPREVQKRWPTGRIRAPDEARGRGRDVREGLICVLLLGFCEPVIGRGTGRSRLNGG